MKARAITAWIIERARSRTRFEKYYEARRMARDVALSFPVSLAIYFD